MFNPRKRILSQWQRLWMLCRRQPNYDCGGPVQTGPEDLDVAQWYSPCLVHIRAWGRSCIPAPTALTAPKKAGVLAWDFIEDVAQNTEGIQSQLENKNNIFKLSIFPKLNCSIVKIQNQVRLLG